MIQSVLKYTTDGYFELKNMRNIEVFFCDAAANTAF